MPVMLWSSKPHAGRCGMVLACSLGTLLAPGVAHAQMEPLEEGLSVGDWTFYPSLELRIRSEYRRDPVDVGGDVPDRTALQYDGLDEDGVGQPTPAVLRRDPAVRDQILMSERARLGMGVAWEVITAKLVLQDARVLGALPGGPAGIDAGGEGTFAPYEGYLDVRSDIDDPWLWVRVGRQRVRWGDGRLIGDDDWGPRAAPFDAARMHFTAGDVDVEVMGAMLAFPGAIPPRLASAERQQALDEDGTPLNAEGTGAQLYGLDATWRVFPLLGFELSGLARIARDPLPLRLTRGDTYTIDGRVFGTERGVTYAVEGAYQLGRVAAFGINRDLAAFAVAAHVDWQTALPWDFRFNVRGAYASGDDSAGQGSELKRFDPILPTTHEHHGMMDLYAWSNVLEAGGSVSAKPHEIVNAQLGYTFVGLAEPGDRWSSANLVPIGADPTNDARVLGHEIDALLEVRPWDALGFGAGYGLFLLGDGGKAILSAAGRGGGDLLHYGYLQAELRVP
jgi:Alginate export